MTENTPARVHYAADVVAVTPDRDVLLIRRGWPPEMGAWALPGGHVDEGETSRTAAARELEEETGVLVSPDELQQLGVWDEPGRDVRGRYVTVAYLARVSNDIVPRAGTDAAVVTRWPADDLPRLAFDHDQIIHAALRQLDPAPAPYTAPAPAPAAGRDRCPAAHPTDPSDCKGPVAVTVIDRTGASADGCEHHAARMLASLSDARVHALPDAAPGAAIRTFQEAGSLLPYAWLRPIGQTHRK